MQDQEKPEVIPQLDASKFRPADSQRNVFQAIIDPGVTRRQVLDPAFFAHIARQLQPYSQIEIIAEDGTLFAKAVVLQAERTWARVHITEWHDLTTRDVSLTKNDIKEHDGKATDPAAAYRVEHKGITKKWCVIRNQDGQYVREQEPSKAKAMVWLDDYLKVTA